MTYKLTTHPDFENLVSDLNTSSDLVIATICRARECTGESQDRFNKRKEEANAHAKALRNIIQSGALMETPGEQWILNAALTRLIKQNSYIPVAGALKSTGRDAVYRLMRQSLLMDALAYDFQLSKSAYVRLCSLTNEGISSDSAERDYTASIKDPKLQGLTNLSRQFTEVAFSYELVIADNTK
jgi:hypothetical protein